MSETCESLIAIFQICIQFQSMKIANLTVHIISFISASIILITYCVIPSLKKNLLLRLVAYLNISNFLWNIASILIIIGYNNNFSCSWIQFFSFIGIFGWSTGTIWSLIFSLNIYWMLKGDQNLKKNEKYALIFNYVIMLLMSIGYTNIADTQMKYYGYVVDLVGVIFLFTAMIGTIFSYIKVVKASKTMFNNENFKKMAINILRYPIVTMIMAILYIIERIIFTIQGEICTTILMVIFIFRGLQGFIDAIIYGFNSSVRYEIRYYFSKRYNQSICSSQLLEFNK